MLKSSFISKSFLKLDKKKLKQIHEYFSHSVISLFLFLHPNFIMGYFSQTKNIFIFLYWFTFLILKRKDILTYFYSVFLILQKGTCIHINFIISNGLLRSLNLSVYNCKIVAILILQNISSSELIQLQIFLLKQKPNKNLLCN